MRYEIVWYSDAGTRKNVIQAFTRLEYVKSENQIGGLTLTIPRGMYSYSDFRVGDILEVWREKNGTLTLQNETAYFVQNWNFYANAESEEYIEVYASDANWLLDTAIVYAATGSADANLAGTPDDVMKSIVNKQLGSAANAARQKLTVAPNTGLGGASISKECSYRSVLATLQEIAEMAQENGVYLVFDIVRTSPGAFLFQTYTGQRGKDHGRSSGDMRLVGKQYGNLAEASFGEFHADERNLIVVGGQGEDTARVIQEVQNTARVGASRWNRRELFADSRNSTTTAELQAEGSTFLEKNKPKRILTGILLDTPGMMYNVHYGFGDILSAEAFGYFVDCHVTSVHVTVDQDGGEQLDIRLRGEL